MTLGTPAAVLLAEQLRTFLLREAPAAEVRLRPHAPVRGFCVPPGLVDIRQAAPALLPLAAPAWSEPELRFLVRPEVSERLQQAAAVLPSDVRIGFWEGLRPLAVQQTLWETGLAYLRRAHPKSRAGDLEALLEGYVARPGAGVPPHSTGSAADIAAVDAFGQVMNPGEPWGRLGTELAARALRAAGMVNYQPEWWHWSYGDEEWARAYDCAPLSFAATPQPDGPGDGI